MLTELFFSKIMVILSLVSIFNTLQKLKVFGFGSKKCRYNALKISINLRKKKKEEKIKKKKEKMKQDRKTKEFFPCYFLSFSYFYPLFFC